MGIAAWQIDDSLWRIEARGGNEGVRLLAGEHAIVLAASDDRPLPQLDEQFIRGEELHLSFPQIDGRDEFGFRLVVRPVKCDQTATSPTRGLFEFLVSVQTSLLDSHPTIDLIAPAADGLRERSVGALSSALHFAGQSELGAVVLLGPHDAPFTSVVSATQELRLRLFGEFLEKGVIRRARPWVILDRSGAAIDESWAAECWQQLAASPLPLT